MADDPNCGHGISSSAAARLSLLTCLAVLVLLPVTDTRAVDVLSAGELASHCAALETEPEGADAQYCIRYIMGFIDGAVATDVNVMLAAESTSGSRESFIERAMRTRAPSLGDQYRAERLAGFCLGEPLPLQDVVEVVVADLRALPSDAAGQSVARDLVYDSLQQHYPCTL